MKQEVKERILNSSLVKAFFEHGRKKRAEKKKHDIALLQKEGASILQTISNTLLSKDIVFWLQYGTLLGYYREHDFIPHDDDMDLGAFIKDAPAIYKALTEAGFERVRHYHVINDWGLEECYRYKGILIDFFYFKEDGDKIFCYGFTPKSYASYQFHIGKKIPFKVIRTDSPNFGFQKVIFKGAQVYVPNRTGEYLEAHYGPNFMTPNANYDVFRVATDLQYYSYDEKPGYGILKLKY